MFFWKLFEFSFDFGWIYGKIDEISKFGQFQGPTLRCRDPKLWRRDPTLWHRDPTLRCRDPTQQRKSTPWRGMSTLRRGKEGGLDKLRVHRGIAKLRRSVVMLRCGVALFTYMCFSHVLLFRYSEDLSIGLMRTL